MGLATQLSEVPLALRAPRGWARSRAGLWFAKAACGDSGPHLCCGRAPLSDVKSRQLVDWPQGPGRALCIPGNGPVLVGGLKPPVYKGVAQPSPSPPAQRATEPRLHALRWGGRLAQGVRHAVGGELEGHPLESAMSWAGGPRVGVGIKGHEPS